MRAWPRPTCPQRPFSGRTAWTRNLQTPLRAYLNTETGSAAVLLGAILVALVWANVDHASYERVWTTTLSIRFGAHGISMDLRGWINSGLMAFFFFVIGLEARREFDLGELRERRRVALPLLAGLGGMVVPVLIYLAINAGHSSIHGWGRRCRRTPRSRSGCSRSSDRACPTVCARISSRSRSSTTSSRCS